jgi:hypothetical protein
MVDVIEKLNNIINLAEKVAITPHIRETPQTDVSVCSI